MILIMKKIFYVLSIVAATIIFTSCAKAPQAEIDAAKAALEQAKTAQANLYVEADFLAVQDSLNAVMVEIEAQSSKLFKSYGNAKEKLVVITTQATELVAKTEVRKEEIKTEVATAEAATLALIEENNQLLAKAPKGKEGKEAIEAIKLDLTGITTSVGEVSGMVASGDLLGAQTKVNAAQQKATQINSELKGVLDKAKIKY
jgi:tRNA U34 5-carboxymethylaminomethyl modifying GTPase MnmE/TrmE